ncbi:MAG: hypothetical protein CVU34_10555 [Betaproteobacteria bacterium HGW-Betaproteobacteria-7]|jgi:hypothetical protein|nr:MAG: hypothetical protein CVU34_10555 [Betaproteobacteria bacterium HGW-Betaproteobacteria-7]
MKPLSSLHDSRINATNILVEMTIGEYSELAADITKKNVFQRRRVGSSKTVYSLLKQDLLRECVIPPVVLALTSASTEFDEQNIDSFPDHLAANKDHLVILDGLQRTYTILDLIADQQRVGDGESLSRVMNNKIRVEFYVGLNRIGILYRMLTLNTGQTPMSLRQQIEILYLDYIESGVEGVELIRETDDRPATQINQYNFKDVVEGFNAYLDRDELPIEKSDILENIASLEKLSKENQSKDLFKAYIKSWHGFVNNISSICGSARLGDDYLDINSAPFGKTALQVFKKPQAMSGFGAAVGKMIDFGMIIDFDDLDKTIAKIDIEDPEAFLEEINRSLEWIKLNTKKIGNAQRSYFQYFFRDLINKDGDSFANPLSSASTALRKYQSQNF